MRSIFLMGGNGRDVLESQFVHGYNDGSGWAGKSRWEVKL